MRDLICTIFDGFKTFPDNAPIMLDALESERQQLIDEFLCQEEAWRILEMYEEADVWDDLAEGIKQYTVSGNPFESRGSGLVQARWKVREHTNLMQDIDDLIYDEWCNRER